MFSMELLRDTVYFYNDSYEIKNKSLGLWKRGKKIFLLFIAYNKKEEKKRKNP